MPKVESHFWHQIHNSKKLKIDPLGDATCTPIIKALGLVVSDKRIFFMFSLYKPM